MRCIDVFGVISFNHVFEFLLLCPSFVARYCVGCKIQVDLVSWNHDSTDLCIPCVYAKQGCRRIAMGQGASAMYV